MKETIENLLNKIGDKFRELTYHKNSKEWTATGIPLKSGNTYKEWRPKRIIVSGKKPEEVLKKLLNKLNQRQSK